MEGPASDALRVVEAGSSAAEVVGGTAIGDGTAIEVFSGALAFVGCTRASVGATFTTLDVGLEVLEEVLDERLDVRIYFARLLTLVGVECSQSRTLVK